MAEDSDYEKVKANIKLAGSTILKGVGVGAMLGGAVGATGAYYVGQPLAGHAITAAITGAGAGSIYMPITDYIALNRGGTDVVNHAVAGTLSGYFTSAAYGGAKVMRIGTLGGFFFGLSVGVVEQSFNSWRFGKGERMKREAEERRRLMPLIELEQAHQANAMTEEEYKLQRKEVTARLREMGVVDERKPVWGQGFTRGGGAPFRLLGGGERNRDEGLHRDKKAAFFEWPEWWIWHKVTDEQVKAKVEHGEKMKVVRMKMEMLKKDKVEGMPPGSDETSPPSSS